MEYSYGEFRTKKLDITCSMLFLNTLLSMVTGHTQSLFIIIYYIINLYIINIYILYIVIYILINYIYI